MTRNPSLEPWFSNKGLNIAHLNVHYLFPKLDEVKVLFNQQPNLDILCLCETFLNDKFCDEEIAVQDYVIVRKDRASLGGGLAIYMKENIPYILRKDLESEGFETLWVEIKLQKQKPLLLGYVYRPPSSLVNWIDGFECILDKVFLEDKEVILLGDFNFDLLNNKPVNKSWLDVMQNYNFTQLINQPTRICDSSQTLIDHLYSNNPDNISAVHVPTYAISDHYPICLTHKFHRDGQQRAHENVINYRSMKKFNPDNFTKELAEQPWSVIEIFDDPNDALDLWINMFTTVLDKHAPRRTQKVKRVNQPNWINNDILTAIKTRNFFHKRKDFANYRVWRNYVKKLITNAKRAYYTETVNNNGRNPRELWKNLHDVSGKHKIKQAHFISGDLILDPQQAANQFNKFFVGVFENLNGQSQNTTYNDYGKLDKFVLDKLPTNTYFSIPDITNEFTEKLLLSYDQTKAAGIDGLNARYLRLAAPVIVSSRMKILNLSIRTGVFPDQFKKAKVTPIHKKGTFHDMNNYRPISVLSLLSKIIERHVSDFLCTYLDTFNLIHAKQSGFRAKHSCQTALTRIVDDWLVSIDQGSLVGTVFLDFSKAFDLVNHSILLQKLSKYKFSDRSLKWFKSYLTDRSQQVSLSGKLSGSLPIESGVPQGSVLGPILFLIFINDLPLHIDAQTDMFADDTTISTSGNSPVEIAHTLNRNLSEVSSWCKNNCMVINTSKTKAMLISTKPKLQTMLDQMPEIKINNTELEITNVEKLLGVNIDQTLTWSLQVDSILKKLNSLLYLLCRIKSYLSIPIRKLFYNSYILPHLDYCCIVWGNCNSELLAKLHKFQKRAARIILDKNTETPSSELFNELNWLQIQDRINYLKSVQMYKTLNNLAPSYLTDCFNFTSSVHSRSRRSISNNDLYVPKPNTELFRKSFVYSGSKLWNNLPYHVKNAETLGKFKKLYLEHLYSLHN